jgi:tetratricopeptide (TPR) repeat protein
LTLQRCRRRTLSSLFAAAISLLACSERAAAQAPDAQAELERGVAAMNAGRFETAASAFDASYRLSPSTRALYQLAVACAAMGQPQRALETYEMFLRSADPRADAANIASAKNAIAHIQSNAGRFTLKVAPADATIEIDGHSASIKNQELWMMPGKHGISIRAPGYESYNQTLEAQTGRYALEINLRRPSGPPSEQANALVDDGMILREQGDLTGALARFQEAEQVYSTPRGLAQLGLLEEAVGEMASAEDHLAAALAAKKDTYIKKNKRQLKKALTRVLKYTRDYATLEVSGSPPGARLFLHEKQIGTLAVTSRLRVPSGRVVLSARLEGFVDAGFEAELPPRSLRHVELQLQPLPPPAPPPTPPPPPPPPPPQVVAEQEPPPPPPPAADQPAKQADIEALLRDQGRPPDEARDAVGFELNVAAGYQFWLGDGPWKSNGAPALNVSLGARVPWPVSFGLSLVDLTTDFGTANTSAVITLSPGIYVRAHSQRFRKAQTLDVWGGAGFVPIAFGIATFDVDTTTQERLEGLSDRDIEEALQLGIGRVVTRQSVNIPFELGATYYLTRGVGVSLRTAFAFWIPTQLCYHDGGDRYCVTSGLKTQHSLYVGAGVSFLP